VGMHRPSIALAACGLLVASTMASGAVPQVLAGHSPSPATVTIAGSLQSELGCPGDWQPECVSTGLTADAEDGVWRGSFPVPAGTWEYKAALDGTWDENYGAGATPNGANIALATDGASAVRFYYSHTTHWVADSVNHEIPTAAGSFQSEIGCPGDWQPDCLRSWLQDPDGDGTHVFRTTALPAGDYEWKVALDEAWDENYGAGGAANGANVAFTVTTTGDPVTFSWDETTKAPAVQVDDGSGLEPGDAELVTAPVRTGAADEVIYFVMTDRFADGQPANNTAGVIGDRLDHGYDPTAKGWYHGGDLAGLQSELDYLQGLGVTALWITPPFTNRWVQGDLTPGGTSAGYHGYWQVDFTQIDPHLGTNAEMVDLVTDAHGRGMKVYFDIVLNHTGDVISYEEGTFTYRNKTDFPYLDASGVEFDDRDYAGTAAFPPLDPATSFPYTPTFLSASDAAAKSPDWLDEPTYYHNRGNSTFVGENSLYGDFFGLDDLFTEHPDVVDGMIDIHTSMIDAFDIDGFRVDTVKHVNDELWEAFVPAVEAHAAAAGKTEFPVFGEVFESSPAFLSRYSTELPFPSTLDFRFNGTTIGVAAASQPTSTLQSLFADDDWFTDADSNASSLVKFVGNHDIGRVGWSIRTSNPGASDDEALARARLAQILNFTTRGVPVVYYGDEQGFTGDGGDQDARQDMFASQVASYNDDDLIGTAATTADANFDTTHPIYTTISELAGLRAGHAALRDGAQLHRYAESTAGVYAFSRIDRDERVEHVVAINNGEAADSATFATDSPSTTFTPLWPAGASTVTSDAAGMITVDVPPLAAVVLRADAPLPTDDVAEAISITTPVAGGEVTGRVPVRAEVSGGRYAEVTFAVSVDGAPFEVVGVDDSAPYAVHHDVGALAPGTPVTYRAIVADLAGNLNAAGVDVVRGEDPTPPGGTGPRYAVVHYQRTDGAYDDWGLHAWGDIVDVIEWTDPVAFTGEDEYGRFAWLRLAPGASNVGFIVHSGDTKDGTTADRFFDPSVTPEIWLKQDDATTYTSQADAEGVARIHYHRPDGAYDGWGLHLWGDAIAPGTGTDWASPRPPDGADGFGPFWEVPLADASQPLNFIIHRGDEKDPGPDQSFVPADQASAWIVSGDETIHRTRGAALDLATIHYHRPAGDYGDATSPDFNDFWGLHVWAGAASPNPSWQDPVRPVGVDAFGLVFEVPLTADATELAHILHRGDTKDPGPDMTLDLETYGHEVWMLQGADPADPWLLPIVTAAAGGGDLGEQRAHWVAEDTILWAAATDPSATYRLHHAAGGGLALTPDGVSGDAVTLTLGTADPSVSERFPHLAGLPALKIAPDDVDDVPALLRGQVAVAATGDDGTRIDATGLQIPGVLDDVYADAAGAAELGVVWDGDVPTVRVWAPTAQDVSLQRFADGEPATAPTTLAMTRDDASGVWSVTGDASWQGQYYLVDVAVYVPSLDAVTHNVVTDPYSVSLSTNSARSQLVDLDDSDLAPPGWADVAKPPLDAPEDLSIYELHVRDFSASDPTVPEELRGTFEAFTLEGSAGMQHLAALAEAGLGAVHLLPAFDFATVDEDRSTWEQPDESVLAALPPDSPDQQALVSATADRDGFNWGYDPWHYTTPEGSYATDPDGVARIVEFRDMVQALNETGLRVVMDVVYNHTTAGGQDPKSVLDRIVPGYYHRLDDEGTIETSTCCANTAAEHRMMEKLLIDSVLTWARDYKVDGFRFDLMGHHPKSTMLALRAALDGLTAHADGVDGASIYLYGEGWNFGEVADDARFVQATQQNMGGTGIGTFNDRLRDAVRGGGPFDGQQALVLNQGLVNGLWYDPNELVVAQGTSQQAQLDELLLSADQTRVGLAGNLAGYSFVDRTGATVTGAQVDYNGSPTGYTDDPQEHIVYVEAHDNQTLWDIGQYHHPLAATMQERVRAQNVGLDLTVLSQGVPFVHAGQELLRSKSMDRNSYDSGDWFNRLDPTGQTTAWGSGLPLASGNQPDWQPFIAERLGDPTLAPTAADIGAASTHAQEMLAVRRSSELFRLRTAAEVQERLAFENTGPDQLPGVIVMTLEDPAAAPLTTGDLDPGADRLAVIFNATDEPVSYAIGEWAGEADVALHPVLAASADAVVTTASFDAPTGTFDVPARTTAVFVDAVDDTTPPVVTAALVPGRVQRHIGTFTVDVSCTDDRTGALDLDADVNGIAVEDEDELLLVRQPRSAVVDLGPVLILSGPKFTLTATCTDAAGNEATATAVAQFRT
jgi:pullulanase-type alpha-1,6-glucosidase